MPKRHRNPRGPRQPSDGQTRGYKEIVKKNEMFEQYYKGLGIMPEQEFDQFMECLKLPLPSTFRITGYKSQSRQLLKMMKHEFFSLFDQAEIDGKKVEPPSCIPWYPDELAWKMNLSRSDIRKNDDLKKLHKFLVAETESGNISRQEAVSMIPPLLLDVKPHHKILDMCAAPGSKTSQIIEYLHANETQPMPDGFVIANDSDNKRCYLMVHQVKRLQSPNFMIVNHDASRLPSMRLTPDDAAEKKTLCYDRVLADVPCSGDGTMRKNPDIWTKWTVRNGMNLHGIQKRILRRGIELLDVGGRLVYSTCSLNPIEDEAVVATLLDQCQGSLELVDVASELPGLCFKAGVHSWKVMTKAGEWYQSWDEVPQDKRTYIYQTMFPPSDDKVENMHLDRCLRILPHSQDTGGFFVAVLRKVKQVPWLDKETDVRGNNSAENEVSEGVNSEGAEKGADGDAHTQPTDASVDAIEKIAAPPCSSDGNLTEQQEDGQKRKAEPSDSQPAKKAKKVLFGYKEDPYIFFKEDESSWPMIRDFYKISSTFPYTQLMVRCETGKKRNIYFLSSHLKNLVICNEDRIKFINMGVKVFSRSPSPIVECDFRLAQDGVNAVHNYFESRKVQLQREDLITLLSTENPFFIRMSKETQKQIKILGAGSALFILQLDDEEGDSPLQVVVVGWIGKTSCRSFVPKNDRMHYLTMLGVPPSLHGDTDPPRMKAETDPADDFIKEESPIDGGTKDESDTRDGSVKIENNSTGGSVKIESDLTDGNVKIESNSINSGICSEDVQTMAEGDKRLACPSGEQNEQLIKQEEMKIE